MYAALAIAVIAVILAALAYFHPAHNKCLGYRPARRRRESERLLRLRQPPEKLWSSIPTCEARTPNDPIADLSVATNARLALFGSGAYLHERIAANTAAPADLVNAVKSLANTIQQLGINYLTGAAPDVQDPLRKDLDVRHQPRSLIYAHSRNPTKSGVNRSRRQDRCFRRPLRYAIRTQVRSPIGGRNNDPSSRCKAKSPSRTTS